MVYPITKVMKCVFEKTNGSACEANAMAGSQYCFHHNPAISAKVKKLAQAKGGQANKIMVKEPLPPLKIGASKDIVLLLEDTIARVRSGEMDLKIATTIGYLSGHLIKAFEVSYLEERVIKIENIVEQRYHA